MVVDDNRPRVLSCIPSRGLGHGAAFQSHYCLASRGAVEMIPVLWWGSLLTHGFNRLWAQALTLQRAGILDYFLLHHDDIEIRSPGWLDTMVAESKRVGAAVLSVVQPIKDTSGQTSTAIEREDVWNPRKLTLAETDVLPETFEHWKDVFLLVNTGLMLIDLSRPEWHNANAAGELEFYFRMVDRVIWDDAKQEYVAQIRPEDWEFSRMCNRAGLSVWATRKILCKHHGDYGFQNTLKGEE